MAGAPIRRFRNARIPHFAGRLPRDFILLDDAGKFRHMVGLSLDQAAVICMWDVNTLEPYRLGIWNAVRHDLWNLNFRIGLEDRRSVERERALNSLVASMPEAFRPK